MAVCADHPDAGIDLPAQRTCHEITPLYDILSVWPYVGKRRGQMHWREVRLAMALQSKNTHYEIHTICARHWHGLAMKHGGPKVWEAMQGLVDRVIPALDAVEALLPQGFPPRIWDADLERHARPGGEVSFGVCGPVLITYSPSVPATQS